MPTLSHYPTEFAVLILYSLKGFLSYGAMVSPLNILLVKTNDDLAEFSGVEHTSTASYKSFHF